MESTTDQNSALRNHKINAAAAVREGFQLVTATLLSLLLPLSFLLLGRLATARYFLSISDDYKYKSLFFFSTGTESTILHNALVSVITVSTLAQGITGKVTFLSRQTMTRRGLVGAWILLCVVQLCVGLGIEGSIAAGIEGSSLGQERGLLCRVLFFLGLHETTRFWWRTVVKPVVDDTVFGVCREEGWGVKVALGVGLGWVWWWRLRDEVEAMAVVAELKRELLMGIGVADFVGWWLYHATVTIGMVRVVNGLIAVFMFFFSNCRPTPIPYNDEKV